MRYIDEKFKEKSPEKTVETIRNILKRIGLELEETWNDSGIENCWSLRCNIKGTTEPTANGKGITKDFARASAYGEFMERLQSGLFFYKFQSIEGDEAMNLHTYASDKKYMTLQELIENGEWMDHMIDTYGSGLSREKIARQCHMYACTGDDKILTVPYYSLFEDKYVYLPVGFAAHMYSANGCCAGNTRAEAWIHALSEIMERRGNIATLTGGSSAPEVPEHILQQFPTVSKILAQMRSNENLDIKIFDYSQSPDIPVISTRIIDKDTQRYIVNTGADPILEIAIQRTLTEIMQGRNLARLMERGNGQILNKITDFPLAHNVLNLLETGNGLFAADFFAEEITCGRTCTEFADHSGKTNEELLPIMLAYYKTLGKPVYVRNYSFLGFPCYKFIVPGFSESRAFRLTEPVQEYALADVAARVLRQPKKATAADLSFLLSFHKQIQTARSRSGSFAKLSGIPLTRETGWNLLMPTLSYAAYRLGNNTAAMNYLDAFIRNPATAPEKKTYFACVKLYLQFKAGKIAEDKIRLILGKFFDADTVKALYRSMEDGTPYDDHLLDCDPSRCAGCKYRADCAYTACRDMLASAGTYYNAFADGQNREQFL